MKILESNERKEERRNLIAKYMGVEKPRLTPKVPVIAMLNIIDVKSSKKFSKAPFDDILLEALEETGKHLCTKIQECKMAYIPSGLTEISLLISDLNYGNTWFNYDVQRVISFIASTASTYFNFIFNKLVMQRKESGNIENTELEKYLNRPMTLFNVTVFNVYVKDVPEYFIGKQYESMNYSMQNLSKAHLKGSSINGKTLEMLEQELLDKNIIWDDMANHYKYGVSIERVEVKMDDEIRHKWIANRAVQLYLEDSSCFNKIFSK